LNAAERASNAAVAVTANPSRREMVVATPEPNSGPASAQTAGAAHANALASKTYTFDGVFGPDATQAEVYESAIEPIVLETLEGFNCTVFAYGQTGTGKTHTMEGAGDEKKEKMERFSDTPNASSASLASNDAIPTNAGIVPRALRQIFSHLANTTTEYSVKCTFLELYNEEITDLLSDDGDEKSAESSGVGDDLRGKRSHRLMEDGRGGVSVEGLTEVTVKNVQDALRLAKTGSGRRKKAATLCNKHSSRSHSVFSIAVTTRAPSVDEEGEDLIKIGKLNLVDLAGSENVGKSGVAEKGATARSREAGEINKSLLTLGRVVTALVDKLAHVPYRDSKLTRLLRDALGGKSKTCILATVGPSVASVEETVATAEYASRARSVRCKPEVNRRVTKIRLVRELQREVQRLSADLIATREKNGVFVSPETFAAEQSSKKQREEKISVLERSLKDKEKLLAETLAQNEAYERAKEDVEARVADAETRCSSLMEKNKQREDALEAASELAERTRIEVAKEKARRKDAEEKNDVLSSRSASETLRLFDRCDRFETREEAISNQLDAVASRAKVASALFEKAFSEAARAAKKAARSEKKKRLEEKRKEAFAVVFESAQLDIERAKEAAMSACAEATKSLERARDAFFAASRGPSGDDSCSSEDESVDECSSAAAAAAVSAALAAAAAVSVPADAPSGATPTRATSTALAAARKAPEESAEDGASDSKTPAPVPAAEMRATRAKTTSLPRAPLRELGENVEEAA
jgi:kinesin family protein 11